MTETKLAYRLITGKDDSSFCERISTFIDQGYVLYGSPAVTFNGTDVIAAQALILPGTPNSSQPDQARGETCGETCDE